MAEQYYTIEIISRRVNLSPAAVRKYARMGVIMPRAWHGRTPLYHEGDIVRLRRAIRLTRDLGLNSAAVEIVLRLTDELAAVRRELAARSGTSQKEDL